MCRCRDSDFFNRTFEGVVAWGLFFLLSADVQRKLITKIAAVLLSGGRLLFTAPSKICSWSDAMTGRTSILLGYGAYRRALEAEGLSLVGACRGGRVCWCRERRVHSSTNLNIEHPRLERRQLVRGLRNSFSAYCSASSRPGTDRWQRPRRRI